MLLFTSTSNSGYGYRCNHVTAEEDWSMIRVLVMTRYGRVNQHKIIDELFGGFDYYLYLCT